MPPNLFKRGHNPNSWPSGVNNTYFNSNFHLLIHWFFLILTPFPEASLFEPSNLSKSYYFLIIWKGDMTSPPSQMFFFLKQWRLGCSKICVPSQVTSSNGNPFHLTKCFMMLLFLNLFSLVSKTSFSIKTNFPSSSRGGNFVDTIVF